MQGFGPGRPLQFHVFIKEKYLLDFTNEEKCCTIYVTRKREGGGAVNCIKCGRETRGEQSFCEDCVLEMEKYPVKPNTYVKLPERRVPPSYRRSIKRRTVNSEEQIRVLKHKVRRLTMGLLLCLVLMAGMMYYIVTHVMQNHYKPGQNYTVITTTEETQSTAPKTPAD